VDSKRLPFLLSVAIISLIALFGERFHCPVYTAYIIGAILVWYFAPRFELKFHLECDAYALLVIGALATYFDWWERIPHFDKWVHFFIHLVVGIAAAQLWSRYIREKPWFLILASVGTVILVGYILELVEQFLWILFDIEMALPGEFYTDTMSDFMIDIGGGLAGIGLWWSRNMEGK